MMGKILSARKPSFVISITLLILLGMVAGFGRWYQTRLIQERRADLAVELALRGNALSSAINRRIALVDGLHAFVLVNHSAEDFDQKIGEFSEELYYSAPGVRNIAIAPDGIIQSIFPLEGNMQALGYEPLADPRPQVRADVQRAIDEGEVVITGPVVLVQGGVGLIVRRAVHLDGEYWGLVNIVLDFPPILSRAGLDTPDQELDLALFTRNGEYVSGSESVMQQSPVIHTVDLPGEDWYLAGTPRDGWGAATRQDMGVFYVAGISIGVLLACLVLILGTQQVRLAEAVRRQTAEILSINKQLEGDIELRKQAESDLIEQQAQYRSIFETVQDGIYIHDLEGRLVASNPSAHQMLGYTLEEFAVMRPGQYILPEYYPLFEQFLQAVRRGEHHYCQGVAVKKDGSFMDYEVFGTPFTFQGKPHAMSVVRDISERVQAYNLLETRVEERTHALYTILQVTQDLVSTLDLEPLLDLILKQLSYLVEYTGAAVFTHESGVLSGRAYRGPLARDLVLGMRIYLADSIIDQEILRRREALIIPDVLGDDHLAFAFRSGHILMPGLDKPMIRSLMGVPLFVKDEYLGNLMIDNEAPDFFQPHHAQLAQAFANQAAIAIVNARLYRQVKTVASLEERQKLARELHDSISQALYGVILGTRTTRGMLEKLSADNGQAGALLDSLEYTESLAEIGLAEMRDLIFELRPELLEKEGLIPALERKVAEIANRFQIDVRLLADAEPDIPLEHKQNLYRIAYEALQNIVKHASATRVLLSVQLEPGWLNLAIEDDGVGFNPLDEYPGHIGLVSMRERAELSRGIFSLDSSAGNGTRITVRVPYPQPFRQTVFQ